MRFNNLKFLLLLLCLITSCSSLKFLKYDKEEELRTNKEFDQKVVVKEVELPPEPAVSAVVAEVPPATPTAVTPAVSKPVVKKTKVQKVKTTAKVDKKVIAPTPVKPTRRFPELEDTEGFDNQRRPLVDPFTVGEKIVHSVTWYGMEAGRLTLTTKPMLEVNGKLSYNFLIGLKSSSMMSRIYSVDDSIETYLDYYELVPHVFKINNRESGKLLQAHAYFDFKTLKADFWEKKYTEKDGEQERKLSWDILPYSQNAFSGVFYMRIFKFEVGKEYSFRVSDDEKNIIFKAKGVKKEKIKTDAGTFDTIKLKAEIVSRGALSQSGDMFMWLTDDDKKVVVRIEADIKVGKLVSELVEYDAGKK